jgi:hypothetical protein
MSAFVDQVAEDDRAVAGHVGYSITSSAVASSEGGMVMPSAWAVLRLITSSNLVGCSIGDRRAWCLAVSCARIRQPVGTNQEGLRRKT